MKPGLAFASLMALAWADAAAAQEVAPVRGSVLVDEGPAAQLGSFAAPAPVPTDIVPDELNDADLGTQVTQDGNTYTIDGGTRAGNNLFHSFTRFDLGQGDFARWVHSAGDPLTIRNVVNRVTGGDPSHIFGTIDSTALPNADFFFINPAGIVFGEGAQVNVPAAAHFSTASELRFADGASFTVATPNGSTFSVANPVGFGFVGGEGAVSVHAAREDFLPGGGTLSLSGSDVSVTDSALAVGSLTLTAVGGEGGAIDFAAPGANPATGSIAVAGSRIAASGTGGILLVAGAAQVSDSVLQTASSELVESRGIAIGAGQIAITNSTLVTTAGADGSETAAGAIRLIGTDVEVRGSSIGTIANGSSSAGAMLFDAQNLLIADSSIEARIFDDATGAANFIRAGAFTMLNSQLLTRSLSTTGTSGSFDIEADSILLDFSEIASYAFGGGDTGRIALTAASVSMTDTFIASQNLGTGGAGIVSVVAGTLLMDSSRIDSDATMAGAETGGIIVRADVATIQNGSELSSTTFGSADGGLISVFAGTLTIDGSRIVADAAAGSTGDGGLILIGGRDVAIRNGAVIQAEARGAGSAGFISVSATRLSMTNGALISSNTLGSGDAGLIDLDVVESLLMDASGIESDSSGSGAAGLISIRAGRDITLQNGSSIESSAFDEGEAGFISLTAGATITLDSSSIFSDTRGNAGAGVILFDATDLRLLNGSMVDSSTFGAGSAGGVGVTLTGSLLLDGGSVIRTEGEEGSSGSAGLVVVRAEKDVTVTGGSAISSNSRGSGEGGIISVQADRITVTDGAEITTDAFASGDGGGIRLAGRSILISGAGTERGSTFVTSDAFGTGHAGSVTIDAEELTVADGAFIGSDTYGQGNAGEVAIDVTRSAVIDAGGIQSTAQEGSTGAAGLVTVRVPHLVVRNDGYITTATAGAGNAGDLDIRSDRILVETNGSINSAAAPGSTGNAGLVQVAVGELVLRSGGEIISDTGGSGNAGLVRIRANSIDVEDSAISSRARCPVGDCAELGAAGSVDIQTGRISVRTTEAGRRSVVSTTTDGGKPAGDVFIRSNAIEVVGSGASIQSATAGAGNAGTVTLQARDVLVDRGGSIFTDTNGAGAAGLVFIDANNSLRLDRGAAVSSNTSAGGAGGGVLIRSPSIELAGQSQIASRAERNSTGNAGFVRIEGGRLVVREGSAVTSETAAAGNAGSVVIAVKDVTVADDGRIASSTSAGGDAGTIHITGAESLRVEGGRISSTSTGTGAAGNIEVTARTITMGAGVIESNAGADAAAAGTIFVAADTLTMENRSVISTSTRGRGPAGQIGIFVEDLTMDGGSRIATNTGGECDRPCVQSGDAGEILIAATGDVTLRSGSEIASNSISGSGNAGRIGIAADRLYISGGRISTGTSAVSTGGSGVVGLDVNELEIDGEGSIETISRNVNPAGRIEIEAGSVLLRGEGARIASSNENPTMGDAGSVVIDAGSLNLFDGAQINTSSEAGAAGDIRITLPSDSIMRLDSRGAPSRINTSSGPGTGGRILISSPFAIISNGGEILALGQSGGANVQIVTQYFITSSDRFNQVAVDGNFLLEAAAYDVSAGTVNRDLSVIDASGVLRGQCAAVRATGQVSQLVVRPIGPYGTRPVGARPDPTRLLTAAQLMESCS